MLARAVQWHTEESGGSGGVAVRDDGLWWGSDYRTSDDDGSGGRNSECGPLEMPGSGRDVAPHQRPSQMQVSMKTDTGSPGCRVRGTRALCAYACGETRFNDADRF